MILLSLVYYTINSSVVLLAKVAPHGHVGIKAAMITKGVRVAFKAIPHMSMRIRLPGASRASNKAHMPLTNVLNYLSCASKNVSMIRACRVSHVARVHQYRSPNCVLQEVYAF